MQLNTPADRGIPREEPLGEAAIHQCYGERARSILLGEVAPFGDVKGTLYAVRAALPRL